MVAVTQGRCLDKGVGEYSILGGHWPSCGTCLDSLPCLALPSLALPPACHVQDVCSSFQRGSATFTKNHGPSKKKENTTFESWLTQKKTEQATFFTVPPTETVTRQVSDCRGGWKVPLTTGQRVQNQRTTSRGRVQTRGQLTFFLICRPKQKTETVVFRWYAR